MRSVFRPFVLAAMCVLAAIGESVTQPADTSLTGEEIVRRADKVMRGESSRSELTMTIVRPNWRRSISMKNWTKGNRYSLVFITAPPREEGQAFLKRGVEMWHWVPSISRMIKIPPSMMSQSWMGSDFTNEDLLRESSIVTDYTHTLLGIDTVDGREAYKIRSIPRPDAPVVWSKVLLWIDTDNFTQIRTEDYDEDSTLVNVMTFSEVREMDGREIPTRMVMVPQDEPEHKTILEIEDMEFNVDVDDSFFSQSNMRRLR
ncbi:MAG: outer membrane lipoprotein-sorting protein [Chitinivibrionales bacterium]|nr:outer membrane lipoprotein-sorting protein [Chitinivibrionales bacterium]